MITFPCAKINLGLNIVSKRKDGYHNLETVFYPIPLTDALEIKLMGDEFPSDVPCDLKITGNAVDCDEQNNLVVKAYNLLAADFRIPPGEAYSFAGRFGWRFCRCSLHDPFVGRAFPPQHR